MSQFQALFIINPSAGGGRWRGRLALIRPIAAASGIAAQWVVTCGPGHAETMARTAASCGFERVVGVGGDGTLQEIVNGLLRSERPLSLGVVPAGTGNDFVRSLGLPLNAVEAMQIACGRSTRPVDVAQCGERYLINIAGAGLDGEVAAAVHRRRRQGRRIGPLAYVDCGVRVLGRFRPRDLLIELDGEKLGRRVLLVAIGNGAFGGGGMRFCPDADPSDGLLDICIVNAVSKWRALSLLPALFKGRHVQHPAVEMRRARVVRLAQQGHDRPTRVHLDGEATAWLPVDIKIVPRALEVACGNEYLLLQHRRGS